MSRTLMMRLMLVVLLLVVSGIAVADTSPPTLVNFSIKDQFDKLHTSGYYQNAVVVLVTGDRQGSKFIEQWAPALTDSVSGLISRYRVKFLPVAHLKGVPFFIKSTIKGKFPQEESKWTLMDYEGLFKKSYDLPAEMCSLVVFDRAGVLQLKKTVTDFDPEVQAEILAAIRQWAGPR